MIKFRKDINGLRAIAVLSVLFFHSKIELFSGGYVGVDIFFVISGYLITYSILSEILKGNFSLLTFYLKRFLRIFPALFTMVLFCIFFFGLILIPHEFEVFGTSLMSQSIFISNIYFMLTSGYFDLSSSYSPLLHTRSLSVEEQFYLLLPIILYSIFKFFNSRYIYWFLLGGFSLSFSYAYYLINIFPNISYNFFGLFSNTLSLASNLDAGYYLFLSRAWELLLGSILAYLILYEKINFNKINSKNPKIFSIIGYIGILLIFISIFLFNKETIFPGFYAIIPTVGTIFLILSNHYKVNNVGKFLSLGVLNFFGNISYSLYLWHWPIMVIFLYLFGEKQPLYIILLGIIISIFISYISYIFIEKKFKYQKDKNYNYIYYYSLTFMIILGFFFIGFFIKNSNGYPNRLPDKIKTLASYANVDNKNKENCHNLSIEVLNRTGPCLLGNNENNISFLVIGDSHSLELIDTLNSLANENNSTGYIISKDGCKPFDLEDNLITKECKNTRNYIKNLINQESIQNVLYIYSWNYYIQNQEDINSIKFSLNEISKKSKNIWIMKQIPQLNINPPGYIARSSMYSNKNLNQIAKEVSISKQEYINQNKLFNKFLDNIKDHNIYIIDPINYFFKDNDSSKVIDDNKILYRDYNHINAEGGKFIKTVFNDFFKIE